MTQETKNDAVATAAAEKAARDARQADALTDAELATVTGGVKPWLDPGREPDTAIFYTVERKL